MALRSYPSVECFKGLKRNYFKSPKFLAKELAFSFKFPVQNTKLYSSKISSDELSSTESYDIDDQAILPQPGHAYFVATPIGHIGDASKRCISILNNVNVILAEDTRHTLHLMRLLKIETRGKEIMSHYEHNYKQVIPKAIGLLKQGLSVAVVSDAGSPGVSDPGSQLAEALVANDIPIHPIAGPSAVIAAISVCGFDTSKFTFIGFIPATGKMRKEKLIELSEEYGTIIFFEAPHRIKETLNDLVAIGLGERSCVLCRELTKRHEEFIRGNIQYCKHWVDNFVIDKSTRIRGEFTIVLGPIDKLSINNETSNNLAILEMLNKLHIDGLARSEAVKIVTEIMKFNKSLVYKLALTIDWE